MTGSGRSVARRSPGPKLLVIDSTRTGGDSATGQLKADFLSGWPDDCFMQVFSSLTEERFGVVGSLAPEAREQALTMAGALKSASDWGPDVIYYRPTLDQDPDLHELATSLLARHPTVPLVTQIMDDWQQRIGASGAEVVAWADRELRTLFDRSTKLLSISSKMSDVYRERYGHEFEPIANGVELERFAEARERSSVRRPNAPVVIRYCGSLAHDMTFQTIVDVAAAVDSVRDAGTNVVLEAYTARRWQSAFERATAGLEGVHVRDWVSVDEFPGLLASADVLLLGYNFDPDSTRYVRLSLPNKLPQYMASGVPVLAVGPIEANGIEVLSSNGLAHCVTERNPELLCAALERIATDEEYRSSLVRRAQSWVSRHGDLDRVLSRFQTIVRLVAAGRRVGAPTTGAKLSPEAASGPGESHSVGRTFILRGVSIVGTRPLLALYALLAAVAAVGVAISIALAVRQGPDASLAAVVLIATVVSALVGIATAAAGRQVTEILAQQAGDRVSEEVSESRSQLAALERRVDLLVSILDGESEADSRLAAQEGAADSIRRRVDRLEGALRAREDIDGEALARRLERRTALQIASVPLGRPEVDGLVLVLAPERTGSTWLFDLLRAHPNALAYPTARFYEALGVAGRRYPKHLSDGATQLEAIEVQRGEGASIPALGEERGSRGRLLAIEKVHPSAIQFDVSGFLERLAALERLQDFSVDVVYLSRAPVDSLRSFLSYRARHGGWGSIVPEGTEPELYAQSYETLVRLAADRSGPSLDYEQLSADPVGAVAQLYRRIWGGDDAWTRARAANAVEATGRWLRASSQTGPFISTEGPDRDRTELAISLKNPEQIDRCRSLIEELRSATTPIRPADQGEAV